MKLSYKHKLFIYFTLIFLLFSVGIVAFEQSREKKIKTRVLIEKLDSYAGIVNNSLIHQTHELMPQSMDSLILLFPQKMRLSIVDKQGRVMYDNFVKNFNTMENHADRPEIVDATIHGSGYYIRTSATDKHEYLYYAKEFGANFVRVALPYDMQIRRVLKADNAFVYFIFGFFILVLVIINFIANRFGKSISQLRDFALSSGTDVSKHYEFPDDELGEVGRKITENFQHLQDVKKDTEAEREKLLQHVHNSAEGICFFTRDRKVQFYNGLFIQYLNNITDSPDSEPEKLFSDAAFDKMNLAFNTIDTDYYETNVQRHGKTFSIRMVLFDDKSFEVIINDISRQEKTRQLKQEMTGNIAHELRTPVTSIRAYLETVLGQNLDEEKRNYFVRQAYERTVVLSELIQDMSLITKIEEAPQSFRMEQVDIPLLLSNLKNDVQLTLDARRIDMLWSIPAGLKINGNSNLLYSIFSNLTDNAIKYAGEGISIKINFINEDKNFYYFSFYDTGKGIGDEQHLPRLFERFYRISEGRTRETGGSGLGLSIVKNAVMFHKGVITAKNRKGGGLEFLFQLHK